MRALLIHPPAATRDLIAEVLGSLSCEVTIVPDEASARARFAAADFPLVLLDESAADPLLLVRALRLFPQPPLQTVPYLLVSTAAADAALIEELRVAGADGVLLRPLSPRDLRQHVQAAAERLGTCALPASGMPTEGLEETLRLHTAHLEELFGSAPEGIAVLDEVGRVLRINGEFSRMFGFSPMEAFGRRLDDLVCPPHLRDEASEMLRGVARGERLARETVRRRNDGSLLHVSILATPIHLRDGRMGSYRIFRDVTERKESERWVRESDERFRQLAENIEAVFYMKDALNTETLYVSPAYAAIWGQPTQTLYDDPSAWIAALHPADRARVLAGRPAALFGSTDAEYRIVRPDGTIRWIRDRSFPVRDEHGKIYRQAGLAEDVTGRRLTEVALRESEERHRAILDALPDLLVHLQRDGRVLGYHPGEGQELGRPTQVVVGTSIFDLLPPQVAERLLQAVEAACATGQLQIVEYEHPVDGMARAREARIAVAGVDRALLIARDVTDRRRADEALRQSEERYRTLFDQAPVGVFQYDASLRLTGCNRAFAALSRASADRLIGLDLRGVRDRRILPCFEAVLEGRTASYEGPYQVTTSDAEIWISLHASPLLDGRGTVVGGIGVLEDISERRAAETELARVNQELRRRTAELESALRSRSQFYVSMNHELRTPISAVMLYHELLLSGALGELSDEQREAVDQAYKSSGHLLELVRDVLDLSKIEAGKLEIRATETHLPDFLDDLLATVRPLAEAYGVELEVEGARAIPPVMVDPRRLRQILLNLVSNAVKFARGRPVVIRCRARGDEFHVAVEDQGHGIAPGDLPRVFEEFVQVGDGETGTGLGLPISKRLAELMQGRLEASSSPGDGSIFTLVLPVCFPSDPPSGTR
jgi:PAS domain S-box-containing protein